MTTTARQQPKTSDVAHAGLERLEQVLAAARIADRDAQQKLRGAEAEIERLREEIRVAHENGLDPDPLGGHLKSAKETLEECQLASQGVSRRVRRAEDEIHRYLAGKAHTLLRELGPEADEIVADIEKHARALVDADRRWTDLQGRVNSYLRALGVESAGNAPSEHALASLVRDLRRLPYEVCTPLPHFTRRDLERTDDRTKRRLKEQRKADSVA